MKLRPARRADLGAVRRLVQRAYAPYIERIGVRPGPLDDDYSQRIRAGQVWIADDDGAVGLIVLIDKGDHLLIENVAVEPRRQHQGIGRALLRHAERRARATGKAAVRLYTHAKMVENLRLYACLGYTEAGRRAEHGFERVFLSKKL